jgi:hypothetical protein
MASQPAPAQETQACSGCTRQPSAPAVHCTRRVPSQRQENLVRQQGPAPMQRPCPPISSSARLRPYPRLAPTSLRVDERAGAHDLDEARDDGRPLLHPGPVLLQLDVPAQDHHKLPGVLRGPKNKKPSWRHITQTSWLAICKRNGSVISPGSPQAPRGPAGARELKLAACCAI